MNRDLALPLSLLAAAAIGCSWISDSGTTNSASTVEVNSPANPANQSEDAVTRENAASDIEAMAEKVLDQKSLRIKTSVFGDKNFTTEVEYVSPDKFRIKSGPGLERIIIGKDVYMFLGDSWAKLPSYDGQLPDIREAFRNERSKFFSDVRFVGEDTVNGTAALVYEYKNKGEGSLGDNDSKIWIAKNQGLPLKIESRYKSGSIKATVVEYEYDPNITIGAPDTK
ncbi:MAG: hypothetical protein PSX80_09005 [bacterium]|nr:hypothetical protein [bacterium]